MTLLVAAACVCKAEIQHEQSIRNAPMTCYGYNPLLRFEEIDDAMDRACMKIQVSGQCLCLCNSHLLLSMPLSQTCMLANQGEHKATICPCFREVFSLSHAMSKAVQHRIFTFVRLSPKSSIGRQSRASLSWALLRLAFPYAVGCIPIMCSLHRRLSDTFRNLAAIHHP